MTITIKSVFSNLLAEWRVYLTFTSSHRKFREREQTTKPRGGKRGSDVEFEEEKAQQCSVQTCQGKYVLKPVPCPMFDILNDDI